MPLDDEELDASGQEFSDFVPAVFARSADEADEYRELLEDHDIPAIVGGEDFLEEEEEDEGGLKRRRAMTRGVPVLVPEVLLEEASEVIADREDLDEFEPAEEAEDEDEDDEELDLTEEVGEELEEVGEALEEEAHPFEQADDLEEDDLEEERP